MHCPFASRRRPSPNQRKKDSCGRGIPIDMLVRRLGAPHRPFFATRRPRSRPIYVADEDGSVLRLVPGSGAPFMRVSPSGGRRPTQPLPKRMSPRPLVCLRSHGPTGIRPPLDQLPRA